MIKLLANRFIDLRNFSYVRKAVCDVLLCFKDKNDEDRLSEKQCIRKNKNNLMVINYKKETE